MKYSSLLLSKRLSGAGFTLIEISLVIALLLGLLAVVFLGLGPYRELAEKAECKIQLAAVQKAVRSHANLNGMRIADPLPEATEVFGGPAPVMGVRPVCPSGGTYTWQTSVPPIGVPYGDCSGTVPVHTLAGTVPEW
jgi:type II secretory pathway pseudopilin PulG